MPLPLVDALAEGALHRGRCEGEGVRRDGVPPARLGRDLERREVHHRALRLLADAQRAEQAAAVPVVGAVGALDLGGLQREPCLLRVRIRVRVRARVRIKSQGQGQG